MVSKGNAAAKSTPKLEVVRKTGRMARDIDVIRQDRAIHLVKGMFVMGGQPNAPRQSSTQHLQGIDLTFRFTPMSGYDLRMLHGLVAMASGQIRGQIATYDAADQQGEAQSAWSLLGETAREFGRWVTVMQSTQRQLAEVANPGEKVGGKDVNRTYESLKRLSEVTIHMRSADGRNEFTTQLINGLGRRDDRIIVALNPRIAAAVTERAAGSFATLSMVDVRKIRNEATLLLYNRLCGYVDAGTSRDIGQDKIEEYIWGNVLPESDRLARKSRRKAILRALGELTRLAPPWAVQETSAARGTRSTFKVARPERADTGGQLPLNLAAFGPPEKLD